MRPVPAKVGQQRPAADAVSNEDGLGDLMRVVPDCFGDGRHRLIDAGRGRLGQQRHHLCRDAETGQLTQGFWIPIGGRVTAEPGRQDRPPDAARTTGGGGSPATPVQRRRSRQR